MLESNDKCSTCEHIRQLKEQGEYYNNVRNSKYKTASVCKVALVVEDYYEIDGELERGGRVSYNPMILKFCPECGKKMNDNNLVW